MILGSDLEAHQSPVLIRPMCGADIEQVIDLAASLREAPHWTRSAYEAAIDPESIPHRVALVAENRQSGKLAGFAVASLVAAQAELESIAVALDQQRRGVGSRLLSSLVDHMKAAGANGFILEVRASNTTAFALYRRLGWSEVGRRVRYYADPEEDAVLMRLAVGARGAPFQAGG